MAVETITQHSSMDPTKAVEKQKIKGFILKRLNSEMLLGCVIFHDLFEANWHSMQSSAR